MDEPSARPAAPGSASGLRIVEVTKRFGQLVVACDHVSLAVPPGQIRGLLGENGAGKSTLMRIACGLERADSGAVFLDDRAVPPGDPQGARAAGIAMVHQHLSLVGPLTVWQNVVLGDRGRLHEHALVRAVDELAERFDLGVDPMARVEDLRIAERQRVEILKCLWRDPQVVVLDEPTSVLSLVEGRRLLELMRALVRDHRRSLVLISHRLEEVLDVTEQVTVMRQGRAIADVATTDATVSGLAAAMLGRRVSIEREAAAVGAIRTVGGAGPSDLEELDQLAAPPAPGQATSGGGVLLDMSDVSVVGADGQALLDSLTLQIGPGEIVGVAGVDGNGQEPLVDLFSALAAPAGGRVTVDGVPLPKAVADRTCIAVIPADRHDSACVLQMSVAENLAIGLLDRVSRRGVISQRLLRERARRLVREYDIVPADVSAPMWSLSGGNQQRVVLARELSRHPKLIVAAQPTRGLDVGVMEYVWDRLRAAAAAGAAVLLISAELDELFALSSRVAVIYRGRIVGEMDRGRIDFDRLGRLMGGHAA